MSRFHKYLLLFFFFFGGALAVGLFFSFSFGLDLLMQEMLKEFAFLLSGMLSTKSHCCYYLCFPWRGCPDPLT